MRWTRRRSRKLISSSGRSLIPDLEGLETPPNFPEVTHSPSFYDIGSDLEMEKLLRWSRRRFRKWPRVACTTTWVVGFTVIRRTANGEFRILRKCSTIRRFFPRVTSKLIRQLAKRNMPKLPGKFLGMFYGI